MGLEFLVQRALPGLMRVGPSRHSTGLASGVLSLQGSSFQERVVGNFQVILQCRLRFSHRVWFYFSVWGLNPLEAVRADNTGSKPGPVTLGRAGATHALSWQGLSTSCHHTGLHMFSKKPGALCLSSAGPECWARQLGFISPGSGTRLRMQTCWCCCSDFSSWTRGQSSGDARAVISQHLKAWHHLLQPELPC